MNWYLSQNVEQCSQSNYLNPSQDAYQDSHPQPLHLKKRRLHQKIKTKQRLNKLLRISHLQRGRDLEIKDLINNNSKVNNLQNHEIPRCRFAKYKQIPELKQLNKANPSNKSLARLQKSNKNKGVARTYLRVKQVTKEKKYVNILIVVVRFFYSG